MPYAIIIATDYYGSANAPAKTRRTYVMAEASRMRPRASQYTTRAGAQHMADVLQCDPLPSGASGRVYTPVWRAADWPGFRAI